MTGWHRKLHIFTVPFYYIEYGLAQLGRRAGLAQFAADDQPAAVPPVPPGPGAGRNGAAARSCTRPPGRAWHLTAKRWQRLWA